MSKLIGTIERKITFELYNEHPKVGDYCMFGEEKPEIKNNIDFIFVEELKNHNDEFIVISRDLFHPVMLKYCWKIKMTVHD